MSGNDIIRSLLNTGEGATLENRDEELRRTIAEVTGEGRWRDDLRALRTSSNTVADLMNQPEFALLRPHHAWSHELEQLRTFLDQSGIAKAQELVDHQQLWGMRELAAQHAAAQFRLPEVGEVARLIAELQPPPIAEWLTRWQDPTAEFRAALERLHTPFLNAQSAIASVSAVIELQSIGRAIQAVPSFDLGFAQALRRSLGDWRDSIEFTPLDLNDAFVRLDLYADRGLDASLVDLPGPAFEEMLDLSGLLFEPPPLDQRYGDPVAALEHQDVGELERVRRAYDWLHRFERQLRAFIDRVMSGQFGSNWPRHRVPPDVYQRWLQQQQGAELRGSTGLPLIAYADFTDYEKIICRKDNWRDAFCRLFLRQENVRESFQRLYPVRNCAMHARPVTQEDELYLYVEIRRLAKAFGS